MHRIPSKRSDIKPVLIKKQQQQQQQRKKNESKVRVRKKSKELKHDGQKNQ